MPSGTLHPISAKENLVTRARTLECSNFQSPVQGDTRVVNTRVENIFYRFSMKYSAFNSTYPFTKGMVNRVKQSRSVAISSFFPEIVCTTNGL